LLSLRFIKYFKKITEPKNINGRIADFSVNYNMSTSGNLKGEKNVDFDNFMMIAYI